MPMQTVSPNPAPQPVRKPTPKKQPPVQPKPSPTTQTPEDTRMQEARDANIELQKKIYEIARKTTFTKMTRPKKPLHLRMSTSAYLRNHLK